MFEKWLTRENGFIFRIRAIQNLQFDLEHGIPCRNYPPQNPDYVSIGSQDIVSKRDARIVPCEPGGTLSDYVPFYFAPRSPMLGSIFYYKTFPQEDIFYLVSKASSIAEAGIPFVFTDGHAVKEFSIFRNSLEALDIVDWKVMHSKFWNITPEDNDRQRRRMAEFLVYRHFPVHCVSAICVKTDAAAQQVRDTIANFALNIPIRVIPDWYF